jgi:hypothetical protein
MNDVKLTGKRAILCLSVLVCLSMVATEGTEQSSALAASSTSMPGVTSVSGRLEVGETITVAVNGLQEWSAQHDARKLVPFLNGRALKGSYPDEVNLSESRLQFHILRTPESKLVWEGLLREPVLRRQVSFSVGLEDGSPFGTVFDYDRRLALTIIPRTWGIASLALVLSCLVLLLYFARNTNMLRDGGPGFDGGKTQAL